MNIYVWQIQCTCEVQGQQKRRVLVLETKLRMMQLEPAGPCARCVSVASGVDEGTMDGGREDQG